MQQTFCFQSHNWGVSRTRFSAGASCLPTSVGNHKTTAALLHVIQNDETLMHLADSSRIPNANVVVVVVVDVVFYEKQFDLATQSSIGPY